MSPTFKAIEVTNSELSVKFTNETGHPYNYEYVYTWIINPVDSLLTKNTMILILLMPQISTNNWYINGSWT